MIQSHHGGGYRRSTYVEANNARFWVEQEGDGPAVVFFHFGLGGWRVFEPEVRALASGFRCVAYDRRFYGRTEAAAEPYAPVDDAIALLDTLGIDRAAFVGLSGGGKLALDVASAHPERVWALVHVAAPVTGIPLELTEEQNAAFDAAETQEQEMALDFEIWAPLGVEDSYRELWRETPDANGMPETATAARTPAIALEEVRVPTLVVVARHDPQTLQQAQREAARRIPGAQLVEVDSDHYLTLREPERITELIRDFLAPLAPQQ